MPEYRAYLIGSDGHITDFKNLVCSDDASAIKQAEALVDGHDVELWQLDRHVAKFEYKPKSKA
jgi:hypothetical protein